MTPPLVIAILAVIVLASVWLTERVRAFTKIGSAATAILFGLLLSNAGVLPGDSPAYDFLTGPGVLAGVVLVLLGVNLQSIRDAGVPMLLAFGLGAVASMVGAGVMAVALRSSVGPDAWKLSGQFTATYVGGGMNFAAVGQELGTRPDLFAAGVAADVIVTAFWLLACLTVPEYFGSRAADREVPSEPRATSGGSARLDALLGSSVRPMTMTDFAGLGVVACGTIAVSETLGALWPAVPKVLWLTTLALALAQVPQVTRFNGAIVAGHYLLLLFLASNGAQSVVARIVEVGPAIFYFAAGTVAIHGVIIFGVGRVFTRDFDLLSIASQANVGGATSAMALAGARRRMELVLPAVAAGMLGNALGNYAGMGVAQVVRAVVG